MADFITQSEPDGFACDILRGRLTKASSERIEYLSYMDACVRTKDSSPYNSCPLLPKELKAPKN